MPASCGKPCWHDFLATCQLVMKSRSKFNEWSDTSVDLHASRRWSVDSRNQFQNRAFPRAVSTDDPHYLSLGDLKGNMLYSFKFVIGGSALPDSCESFP